MGIVYACLTPHAPILLPSIGQGHRRKVEETDRGLQSLCRELQEVDPEVLVLVTPHGPLHSHRLTLFAGSEIGGNFSPFGYPEVGLTIPLCQRLNQSLMESPLKKHLSCLSQGEPGYALDHGALVPLYFLEEAGLNLEVTLLSMGLMSYLDLFSFGEALASIIEDLGLRGAILASGDLSHRLTPEAPAGYTPKGEEFDREVKKALLSEDREALLHLDTDLIQKAGECGLRPLILLMGSIQSLPLKGKIFSYEGPFGVGYMVAGFKERDNHG